MVRQSDIAPVPDLLCWAYRLPRYAQHDAFLTYSGLRGEEGIVALAREADAAIVVARPLVRLALIARIRSRAPFFNFDPTAHQWDARAGYTHLCRLPLGRLKEARLLGVLCIFPFAVAALVNLPTARVSALGHSVGVAASASDVVSIYS